MIQSDQWNSLLHLKRSDFKYPDQLDWSIVRALDVFISIAKSKPQILSDYRPGDPRQHGKGRAIDTAWPGADPLEINRRAMGSNLFSGVGIYVNEQGVASHHFDTRTDRTPAKPATWGGVIKHEYNEATNSTDKTIAYASMAGVIDLIKKKLGNPANVALMVLFVLITWAVISRKQPT